MKQDTLGSIPNLGIIAMMAMHSISLWLQAWLSPLTRCAASLKLRPLTTPESVTKHFNCTIQHQRRAQLSN